MSVTKKVTVGDIIPVIHKFAPPGLALHWDNSGFLLGNSSDQVKKILLCLDITEDSVEYAVSVQADLIISHHPLIFKPIKKITNPLYIKLIRNKISVICAHTNLDITRGGVNHKLAELFALQNLKILSPETGSDYFQVGVYVPTEALLGLKRAVFSAGAGIIDKYINCSAEYPVKGQYTPQNDSKPYTGIRGKQSIVSESKLEFFTESFNLSKVIRAMLKAHPYEQPVYAVYPQQQHSPSYGLGLIGELKNAITLESFAQRVKEQLKAPQLKLWLAKKNKDTLIKKVAVSGGSGGSMILSAVNRADVFLSGEFGYHNMLDSPLPLIEAGHFHTEYPVLEVLKDLLCQTVSDVEILPLQLHETSTKTVYL